MYAPLTAVISFAVVLALANAQGVDITPTDSPTSRPTDPRQLYSYTVMCPRYSGSNTASATANYQDCLVYNVCPGVRLLISDCSSNCVGDQYIRLYNENNVEVIDNDDGPCEAPLNFCSSLSYIHNGDSCATFTLRQGCYNDESCSGKMKVHYAYTPHPTSIPTTLPSLLPSPVPTFTPTQAQTSVGFQGNTCAAYSVTNTNSAAQNYAVCQFQVCPGTVLTIGDCSATCSGDQYIRLYDQAGTLLSYSDDGCDEDIYSSCSQIRYVYASGQCQTFSIREGCFGDTACSGTMTITRTITMSPTSRPTSSPSRLPTAVPTEYPTFNPTSEPTFRPTALPTVEPSAKPSSQPTVNPTASPSAQPTVKPSAEPTVVPTAKPSSVPTPAPTMQPLTGFATTNINNFTPVLQTVWYRAKYVGVVLTVNDCTWNYADDADCQAAYPGAQIITLIINGLPVKLAISGELRAPSTLPTVAPTSVPTLFPSAKPSLFPTYFPTNFPVANPTGSPVAVAVSGCGPNGESCASLNWVYKDYTNRLGWAWVSPCSGGCSTPVVTGARGYVMTGWRFPTNADWAVRPSSSVWGSGANVACASTYFDPNYTHCDWSDPASQYLAGNSYETFFVHDL